MICNAFKARLAQVLTSGGSETEVYIDSLQTLTGEAVTFATFSPFTRGVITVDPESVNSDQPEFISFTGINATNIDFTGCTRGLSALSNSAVTANKVFHPVNTPVIIAWGGHNIQDLIDYVSGLVAAIVVGTATNAIAVCGENVSAGNLVYLKNDGKWWKTDADIVSTIEDVQLGIAQGSGTANGAITNGVMLKGLDTHQSGLVAGTTYYASNTAGSIASSAGTTSRIIGVAKDTTNLYFDPDFGRIPSIGGTSGSPSASNKFVTSTNVNTAEVDQSQATQDAVVTVGEADSTTKHNLLAQSFIPTVSSIKGIKLYKAADTGSFTGTVTISLQADSSDSPSGSNLASQVIANATWLLVPTGEFEVAFTAEYTAMTVGSLYWIVITCSTSDNSNHPNVGSITAGAYANGSVKFKNTTDGWTAIATIDLYFKTINATGSKIVQAGTDGRFQTNILPYSFVEMNTTDSATVASSVTLTTVYTKELSAGFFSTTSGFRLKGFANWVKSTGNANGSFVDVYLNGTSLTGNNIIISYSGTPSSNVVGSTVWEIYVINTSATAQKTVAYVWTGVDLDNTSAITTVQPTYFTTIEATSAINTALPIVLQVKYQNNASDANISFTHRNLLVEKIG